MAEDLNLSGKDWLTVNESEQYCGASVSQFREHALAYGLTPRRFMGKQLYERAELYAAIHGAEPWQRSTSAGRAPTSLGAKTAARSASPLGRLTGERRREFVPRKKPN